MGPSGALVGEPIYVGYRGANPGVAFDGTNYLLLWQDCSAWIETGCTNTLYGQFISKEGTLVNSAFPVTHVEPNSDPGGLAFGGGKYFVVYQEGNGLYGTMITASGAVGNAISIGSADGYESDGINSIAFDGANFLVVWDTGSAVKGRFIGSSGETAAGPEFIISTKTNGPGTPVNVAFDGTNYLVVWHEGGISDGFDGSLDVYGQLVNQSGAPVGEKINVSLASGDQFFPSIAFDGTNYLVTWTDMRNDSNHDGICNAGEKTCWDIRGQYISKSGALVGAEISVVSDAGNQVGGVAGFNDGKYLVLLNKFKTIEGEAGDVYGSFLSAATPAQYTLTVTVSGTGSGEITADKGTLTCDGNTCSGTFDKGTRVSLTATAASGSEFKTWGSACKGKGKCVVSMSKDMTATAEFAKTYPAISVTPSSLNFGKVKLNASVKPKTLKIVNKGKADLTVSSVTVEGTDPSMFTTNWTGEQVIKPKASFSLAVTFTPASSGSRSATLKIESDDPESPKEIKLSGTVK